MAVTELTSELFPQFVKSEYAIVDCYGEFCAACVMLEPVFDAAAITFDGICFGRINLTFNEDTAKEFGIDAMPTILFFRNGELVNRHVGSLEEDDLVGLVSQLLYR